MTRHRHHARVALGAACLMIAVAIVFNGFSFVNPGMAQTFHAPLSTVVVYYSIMAFTGALSMTFLSPLLARWLGARWIAVAGGAWSSTMLALMSVATQLWHLYVLGFGLGLTFAVSTSLQANVLVGAWFESRRGAVLGAVTAAGGLGGLLLGLVMPHAIHAGGWRLGVQILALLYGAFTVAPGLLLIRTRPADVGEQPLGIQRVTDPARVEVPGVPKALALRSRAFLLIVASVLALQLSAALMQRMAPFLQEHGVDLTGAGVLIAVLSVATTAVTILLGVLNDRLGPLRMMWAAIALGGIGLLTLIVAQGFVPLAGGLLLAAWGYALPGVLVSLVVLAVFGPRDFVAILGPTMAMMPLGMSIGAPLWGLVHDLTGAYSPGLWMAAGLCLAAGGMITLAVRGGASLRQRVERDLAQGYRLLPPSAS